MKFQIPSACRGHWYLCKKLTFLHEYSSIPVDFIWSDFVGRISTTSGRTFMEQTIPRIVFKMRLLTVKCQLNINWPTYFEWNSGLRQKITSINQYLSVQTIEKQILKSVQRKSRKLKRKWICLMWNQYINFKSSMNVELWLLAFAVWI